MHIFFTENKSSLPPLSPAQLTKLKHLTIISLASQCRVRERRREGGGEEEGRRLGEEEGEGGRRFERRRGEKEGRG